MKTFLSIITLAVLAVFLFSFTRSGQYYINILQQLAISEDEAKEYIFGNFEQGNLSFPYSKAVKALIPGKRAAAVKEMGDYIRQYTSSPAFIQHYKDARDGAKPKAPANTAEKLKARLEEIAHDIETNEEGMKEAKGDMKKLYEATLQMLRTEQKALKDPKDPQHGMFMESITGMDNMGEEEYKTAMKDFEKQYPANVKDMVKRRLQEFLALTAGMDFNAALVERDGRKRFADPKLEAKDELWKRCFRSGRETIEPARAFAQQWLKEIN